MRTFHIGGAAQKGTEISSIESKYDGTIKYFNIITAKDSSDNLINMSRSSSLSVLDDKNKERAKHRLPFGCKLKFENNKKLKRLMFLLNGILFITNCSSNKWTLVFKGVTTSTESLFNKLLMIQQDYLVILLLIGNNKQKINTLFLE